MLQKAVLITSGDLRQSANISRDQFMARHRANHVSIAYAATPEQAPYLLLLKASTMAHLGLKVHLCGLTQRSATLPTGNDA